MRSAGIDVGHYTSKAVILEDNTLIGYAMLRIAEKAETTSAKVLAEVFRQSNLSQDGVKHIVATGIGRKKVTVTRNNRPIAICLAKAANWFCPTVKTAIDIGAETCTVVKVDNQGRLLDMEENDKCAGGSGLFLDSMAKFMKLDRKEMSEMALKAKDSVELASMCVIFAEQELITYIHQQPPPPLETLVAGIYQAVARRLTGFALRVRPEPDFVLTGGVANNRGFVKIFERELGKELRIPDHPEMALAIGAALLAQE